MGARGRDLQEVVLVEDPDWPDRGAGELADPEASSSGGPHGPSGARRGLMWVFQRGATWSLIAAGLAIVVGSSHLFTVQQERERMAAS